MSLLRAAVYWFFRCLEIAIFARAILSWIPIPKDNWLIRLLYQITEPVLAPIRHMLERSAFGKNMMIDLSPFVALLLIMLASNIVASVL